MFFKKINFFYEQILDFLFPQVCLGCQKEGKFICRQCFCQIKPNLENSFSNHYFTNIFPLTNWEDKLIQKIIKAIKFRFAKNISNQLKPFFKKYLPTLNIMEKENCLLTAVPLHKLRQNERGFNQSEILAQIFSDILKIPYSNDLLLRNRYTKPQSTLQGKERLLNVKDAFEVNQKAAALISKKTTIFLVDDVCSTEATLNECAKALQKIGFFNLQAIVLASGVNC